MLETFVTFKTDENLTLQFLEEEYSKRVIGDYLALFRLAGFTIRNYWVLPDQYAKRSYMPWILAKTDYGLIKMGYRKRVISINWEDTNVELKDLTDDEVTKKEFLVHAWTYPKALEYLENLHYRLKKSGVEKVKKNPVG